MSEKLKSDDSGNQYFAVVDEVGKRPFRETIVYQNQRARRDPETGEIIPVRVRSLDPSDDGIYTCNVSMKDEFEDQVRVMMIKAKDKTKPIIGPFDSRQEAMEAKAKARKLTETEELAVLRAKAKESEKLEAENATLTAQLKELKAGGRK